MINTHNKNTSCWALANSDCNFWKLNQANAFWQLCRHLRDLLPFKSGALHRLHLHPVQQQLLRQHRHHLREAVQDDAGSDNGWVWCIQSRNFGDNRWGQAFYHFDQTDVCETSYAISYATNCTNYGIEQGFLINKLLVALGQVTVFSIQFYHSRWRRLIR